MKNFILGFLAAIILLAGGAAALYRLGCWPGMEQAGGAVRYHCPMHPTFISDNPKTPCPICGMDLVPIGSPEDAEYEVEPDPVPGHAHVMLTAERIQTMGLTTVAVRRRNFTDRLRAYGRVVYDETRLYNVRTKFTGYIEELFVDYLGKQVKKDEPLFTIYSPELFATQNELLLALAARDRHPELSAGSPVDLVAAARQRLALWDIEPAEIQKIETERRPRRALTLYAPVAGYVTAKNIWQGMKAVPGDNLYDIADLSVVWVLADIYEADLGRVRVGQTATITLPYQPGREWRGSVTYIDPTLDATARTARARVVIANADYALKPEMYTEVVLGGNDGERLALPEDAIVATGERNLVFVDKGEGMFEPREVTLGLRSDNFREIRSGLDEGEKVVLGANFLVDSESRLQSSLSAGNTE